MLNTKATVARPAPQLEDHIVLQPARPVAYAAVEAMRPLQWSKNLLVFAGIVFAAEFRDIDLWVEASVAFVAYCAASSAAYVANDLRDAPADREHPIKRLRPIARGDVSPTTALLLGGVLLAVAVMLGALLGLESLVLVLAFVALQAGYTMRLKHIVLLDVFAIAALFVIRATAGAVAVDVPVSEWLLVCTALLALFLGLAQRRAELRLVSAQETPGRQVLSDYSLELIDQLVSVAAASTIIAYSLYTFTAHDSKAMMLTIPFVMYGVFRYLLLIDRDGRGEEPERVLVTDKPLILAVVLWALTAVVILALT